MRGSRALPVGVAVTAILLNGCVFGHPKDSVSSPSGMGDRNLAQPAQSQPDSADSTAPNATVSTSATQSGTPATPDGGPSPRGTIARISDPAGDAGAQVPGYGDGLAVDVDDLGSSAKVTVHLGAAVPETLGAGEVEGIGVNLTPSDQSAPSYQLFADGEVDGWFGYLQVGDQFVEYPGTFDRTGASLVFTVPWSALGDVRTGTVDAFVDWSKPTVGTAAQSSSDRLPDGGAAAFTR